MVDRPIPQDKDQRIVKTPYGRGLVVRTRPDGTHEVQLLEWEKSVKESRQSAGCYGSSRKPHMMYTRDDLESVDPKVGDDVICTAGRGTVTKIVSVKIFSEKKKKNLVETEEEEAKAEKDAAAEGAAGNKAEMARTGNGGENPEAVRRLLKYEVELSSWRLAYRSKVKCYLYKPAIRVVRKKMISEMNSQERVEFAQKQKVSASKVFKEKQYQQALNLYAGAVDAVRFVQHDATSTNETRADLVEVMVTCSNNAGTCCAQLNRWPEAEKFAQNSLVLLDALINKKGLKIHTILTSDKKSGGCDLCDAKLFGEWRVKSYLIIARGQAEKKDYAGAIEVLKRAREIILEYCKAAESGETNERIKTAISHLRIQDKEVRRLMTSCLERRKAEKKKEKQRAKAMFASPAEKTSDERDDTTNEEKKECSSPPSSPSIRGSAKSGENPRARVSTNADGENEPLPQAYTTPEKVINPKYIRTGHQIRRVDNLPRQSSLKKNRPQGSLDRRVSFSNEVSERQIEETFADIEDEEEESFLEKNKEALILVGIAGLATLGFMVLRGPRR